MLITTTGVRKVVSLDGESAAQLDALKGNRSYSETVMWLAGDRLPDTVDDCLDFVRIVAQAIIKDEGTLDSVQLRLAEAGQIVHKAISARRVARGA